MIADVRSSIERLPNARDAVVVKFLLPKVRLCGRQFMAWHCCAKSNFILAFGSCMLNSGPAKLLKPSSRWINAMQINLSSMEYLVLESTPVIN